MHYNIKYEDREKPATLRKACCDALDWLGSKRYRILAETAKGTTGFASNREQFHFFADMAGFSGFPVTAMWKRYSKCGT